MVNNGSGKTSAELIAEVDRLRFEERVREEVERRLAEAREREQEERAQEAEQALLGTRRSTLTAKEKSAIIRSRGKAFYDGLPW